MKKQDLLDLAARLKEKADTDYYGKEPSSDNVLRDLNYKLKPIKTFAEWKFDIADDLENCMRMTAALASWMRLDSKDAQRIARTAFDEIKKETVELLIRKVLTPHDEENTNGVR